MQKKLDNTVKAMEKADVQGDAEAANGYKKMEDQVGSTADATPSVLWGYVLTFLLASFAVGINVVTSVASKDVAFPPYTENFVRCFGGCVTLFIMASVGGMKLMQDSGTMKSSIWLAVADWFFLWGYVKAMSYFDSTQYSATSVSMTPLLSVILGFACLGEQPSLTKLVGMARNVLVVILVIDPFGFFKQSQSGGASAANDSSSGSNVLAGFAWGVVACLGTSFMRIVQRSLTHVPPTITTFWCFAINTVLWFPPGSMPPEVRVPFLWPATPQDASGFGAVPASVWICTLFSGVMGALMIAGQAIVLRYIDVGTFSNVISPLGLALSFVVDFFSPGSHTPLRVALGVLLAAGGIAAECIVSELASRRALQTAAASTNK